MLCRPGSATWRGAVISRLDGRIRFVELDAARARAETAVWKESHKIDVAAFSKAVRESAQFQQAQDEMAAKLAQLEVDMASSMEAST